MRKFLISLMMVLAIAVSSANAQTLDSRTFENVQVTLIGGGITTQHTGGETFFWGGAKNIVKGIRPVAGLEIAKYVTPVVGFGIEGLAMFGTTGSYTFVDQSNVVGNLKLNLSNWFGGYHGQPRRVEVVFVPGLGWGHNYGTDNSVNPIKNYLTYNLGAELNINLGKARAWQINIKPVAVYNNYRRELGFHKENLQGRIQLGLTYKFGSVRKKSHNFVACPYHYTDEQYNAIVAERDMYKNKPAEKVEVVREVLVEKVVENVIYQNVDPLTVIFQIGSANLSSNNKNRIAEYAKTLSAKNVIIQVVGSADSKTGSKSRNEDLANERAEAVVAELQKFGIDSKVETVVDFYDNPVLSRAAIIRVAE